MWDDIELREVRVFLTLAEELHFGRTAERLHLTQSRISQTLRSLERKLGGQLVHRTSRHVRLTDLGEQFRNDASQAQRQLQDAFERAHAATHRSEPPLRLGLVTIPSGGPYLLDIVHSFEECHPQYPVTVNDAGFDAFRRDKVDVLASWLPHGQPDTPALVVGPTLTSQPRVLAVAYNHPLAAADWVSLEDIAEYQVAGLSGFPQEFYEGWIPSKTPTGRPISRLPIEGDGRTAANITLPYYVAAGKVVHPTIPTVAEVWGHQNIVYIPITDMPPWRATLLWRRGASSPALNAFIRLAREVLNAASERSAQHRPRDAGTATPRP